MKTNRSDRWRVTSDEVGCRARAHNPRHASRVTRHLLAFTLIELLVVLAIIGTLAALVLPVAGGVKRRQYIANTRAEMERFVTAIENYKTVYGFYPPDNQDPTHTQSPAYRFMRNPLYYELVGVTNNNGVYQTLDGRAAIPTAVLSSIGVSGFMNCSKPGGGEDSAAARDFLPELKPSQMGYVTNLGAPAYTNVMLVTSVGGPANDYRPLGIQDLNPWRYNSSNPTNNPGAYDLWVQLDLGPTNQLNLICNWARQVQIGLTNVW